MIVRWSSINSKFKTFLNEGELTQKCRWADGHAGGDRGNGGVIILEDVVIKFVDWATTTVEISEDDFNKLNGVEVTPTQWVNADFAQKQKDDNARFRVQEKIDCE
jgi:flagellar basal body P-ring protein FlgI